MARTGITKSQVRQVRAQLLAEGRYPSADAARAALGGTGSKSTIHRYLKELASEDAPGSSSRQDTERSLQALVGQLAEQLHRDAEQRLCAVTASHEDALRRKDAEIAELRAELRAALALLSARLPAPPAQAQVEVVARPSGFGHFDSLASGSRSGPHGISAFSIMLSNDRNTLPGLKFQ